MTQSATATDPLAELIRERRTVHDFRPEAPPRELILQALELARWAPNHHLTEPWRYYLLGPETALAIAELNAERVSAKHGSEAGQAKRERWRAIPGWLAVTCDRADDPLRRREDYAACCCGIQNLMLFLWQHGIGVKWTTGAVTRDPAFYDLIWVDPALEEIVGLLWYGYPAVAPQALPAIPRKPLESVLVELP